MVVCVVGEEKWGVEGRTGGRGRSERRKRGTGRGRGRGEKRGASSGDVLTLSLCLSLYSCVVFAPKTQYMYIFMYTLVVLDWNQQGSIYLYINSSFFFLVIFSSTDDEDNRSLFGFLLSLVLLNVVFLVTYTYILKAFCSVSGLFSETLLQ